MRFEGIYTPVITPYREDGSIDRDAFVAMIEYLIASGVYGLINGGSTGEYYAQSMAERKELASFAKDVIGGRLPLIVGTGAIRITEDLIGDRRTCRQNRRCRDPCRLAPYSVPDGTRKRPERAGHRPRRRSADHALQLSRPHGHQHGSGISGPRGPQPEFLRDQGKLGRYQPCASAGAGLSAYLLEPWTIRRWNSLPGGTQLVCAGSNFLPAEHIALWRACAVDGDFARGRRIMPAMLPLMAVLEQAIHFQKCK